MTRSVARESVVGCARGFGTHVHGPDFVGVPGRRCLLPEGHAASSGALRVDTNALEATTRRMIHEPSPQRSLKIGRPDDLHAGCSSHVPCGGGWRRPSFCSCRPHRPYASSRRCAARSTWVRKRGRAGRKGTMSLDVLSRSSKHLVCLTYLYPACPRHA